MFIPPINIGGWKPSPATMSEWIYQIWKYLQENPIATQEQIIEFINEQIGDDISEKLPEVLPEELDKYFAENPIDFPVDSVNGKLGAVMLELADIVQSDSMLPVVSLANDEADQETLVESFDAGARICVIDDESVSVMLPTYAQDGSVSAVTLLPMSTGDGDGGGDFSPITLSIGSSGNKTLNAGGTVAFTLSEIGAASSSALTAVDGRLTTVEGQISSLASNDTDQNNNIVELDTRTSIVKNQTVTLTDILRCPGIVADASVAGFTLILGKQIASDVTTVTTSNFNATIAGPAGTLVTNKNYNPTSASGTPYVQVTIAMAEIGALKILLRPDTSMSGNTGKTCVAAISSGTAFIFS